jgi:hypothetical protein
LAFDRCSVRWALFATVFVSVVALSFPVGAHVVGLSRSELAVTGPRVRATLVFRSSDVALAVSGLDGDGDGKVTQAEVDRAAPALKSAFVDSVTVIADGSLCLAALEAAEVDLPDGLRLASTYLCPHAPGRLRIHLGFLALMPASHRHLVTVHLANGDVEALRTSEEPDLDLPVSSAPAHRFASLLREGIKHILTGADHVAFLVALVVGGTMVRAHEPRTQARVRVAPLVAMLTAFTVGHSASLAIATLGGFAPGPRIVEPAVALSVAYVGAENVFGSSIVHRWRLTLAFGFVHGFAFAGGLIPLGLPRQELPAALLAFNVGVELGQLLVLAVLLPPLAWLAPRSWYRAAARGTSAAIGLAGLAWFVERLA